MHPSASAVSRELATLSLSSLGFRTLLALLLFTSIAHADRFRGQARNEFLDQIPVGGAQIEMVDANDPSQTATVVTDALGYFETSVFDAGDEINITATHPAYAQETPTVTLASTDHFESILMTPLGDVTTDYHDIVVQISGAVSQLALAGVPVEITRWSESGDLLSTDAVTTDAKGVAVLRGAPSGFYEFKLNDSSLPDTDRRARYEDYATPPGDRVEIVTNHFINVFLKPLYQDLRVVVNGYNFKTKESDVPLGDVLVEISGVDPTDTTHEVLHPRNDFTKLFPADDPAPTITDDEILISDGEVVFQTLPPVAYKVKVARYGYITQTIVVEPDPVTGLLPYDTDTPLAVTLPHEAHNVDILVDFPDYVEAAFDDNTGLINRSGVTGLYLKVRIVGLEGTNTDGLEYEGGTVQNLNGETYAPFFDAILPGRYRVYVDGLSEEQPVAYNAKFDFFQTVGHAYDLASTGENILEITPGYLSLFPKLHRHTVSLETPKVFVRGQLMAAETIESDSGRPIFRPYASQTIEIVSSPLDDHHDAPTTVTVESDADGRFSARLFPGLYGIRLPGMDDYFGDEVIVHIGEAVDERDAHRTQSYEWPLVEAFPDVPGSTSSTLQAYRYFELDGLPIHAGREQFLELRVRRERYTIDAYGTEQTDFNSKVIAITSTGSSYTADYSPTLANQTAATLHGSTGDHTAPVQPEPPGSFVNPLFARWADLPPGEYTGISATVPAHTFASPDWTPKTFFDWPVPGEAPTAQQAELFDVNHLPHNELPWEPLQLVPSSGFEVTMTPYDPFGYSVYEWEVRTENGEEIGEYKYLYESTEGYLRESTVASGYFGGYAELGGPVTAIWTTGLNDDGESYRVRMIPGGSLYLRGPSPTPASTLPTIKYSLRLDGVAAQDQALAVDGAHYAMGDSGRELQTGQTLPGLSESPYVYKIGGDNFYEQFQSGVRFVGDGLTPTLAITVGLEQGMEVAATVRDMTPIGSSENPIDIPAADLPVQIHNRYGRLLATQTADEEGKVLFQGLPGYADYFLSVDRRGYTPVRRRLLASEATPAPDSSTAAKHHITQDVTLLPHPSLHEPGIPLNRWGLFLPTVSRSGDVNAEDAINTFDFFAATEALTSTWKVEAVPHPLNVTLPGFDEAGGTAGNDETLTGPDAIVAAYLIDERRFQKDGFVGGTDPLENEELFDIPPHDEPALLAQLIATVRANTGIQGKQVGSSIETSQQRRVFVDEADSIAIDKDTGRTVITGMMLLSELPPGDFDPVIVLETQRGAFLTYDVPYNGDDAVKRLHGPALPPWFANVLDLFGIASGVASTQGRLEEAFKEYVPDGTFIPLPDFSATITVDKDNNDVDEGFLQYTYKLGMEEELGQGSKADGLLALGPGLIGAKTKVEGTLFTDGRANKTTFEVKGTVTEDSLVKEAYAAKIAPIPNSEVEFSPPTGTVSLTASSNWPAGASEQDPLKFSVSGSAGVGATAKVSTTLNNYARAIPYAGPVIGFLGDAELAKLKAFIEGRATVSQTVTLETEFPRARKVRTIPRGQAVPRRSFLGETSLTLDNELCVGVGFSTGLELTSKVSTANYNLLNADATISFDVGGGGCGVSDDIGTMELKFNPTGGWPLITEISGEAKIAASATASSGPAKIKGEWEFAKTEFKVQFGTETVVTHFPILQEFSLAGDLSADEGLFTTAGPEIVGGLPPASSFAVNGALTDSLAYPVRDDATGTDRLLLADRTSPTEWSDPLEIELADRIGIATALTLGDGRTLIVYTVLAAGEDPFDPYSDHLIYSRLVGTDDTVGDPVYVAYLNNPPTTLRLAESGNRVELHTKAPATDGTANYWQLFLSPFDKGTDIWGSTQFRVNESDDFRFSLTAGGPDGAEEILVHWVTDSGVWKWLRTTDDTPQTVTGTFTGAPASWATAAFYEIVAPSADGTILRYGQTALTGAPSLRDTPLVTGVAVSEVGLTQQSVTSTGGYLLAWIERIGNRQQLAYLIYDPDGQPTTAPLPLTANPRGNYTDLQLTRQNSTAAYAFARFTNGNRRSLRVFEIDLINGLADNDADRDGLTDPAELRIVDANPDDPIETIDQVLESEDFDSDGATNGDEIRAGTDPLNPLSFPDLGSLPVVTLALLDASATEWGADPGSFRVLRASASPDPLEVTLAYGGTATSGVDYTALPTSTILAADSAESAVFNLVPLSDAEAEGPETVSVSLAPTASYSLGSPSAITLGIADRPLHQWRFEQFGEDANAPRALAAADEDGDGIVNLLEYVLLLDPLAHDFARQPELRIVDLPPNGERYLEIAFRMNPEAVDIAIGVEGGSDFGSFTDSSSLFEEVDRTPADDSAETVTLRSTLPIDQLAPQVFRLRFSAP